MFAKCTYVRTMIKDLRNDMYGWRDGLVASVLDQRPRDRGFASAGCGLSRSNREPSWAWAYTTLHPLGVGKWVPAIAGKV